MAIGNYIGGILGGYNGGDYANGTAAWHTSQAAATYTLQWDGTDWAARLGQAAEALKPKPPKKGPESALEWLDRRVNEIRVPLAA